MRAVVIDFKIGKRNNTKYLLLSALTITLPLPLTIGKYNLDGVGNFVNFETTLSTGDNGVLEMSLKKHFGLAERNKNGRQI